jgi:hypothetical protein
MQISIGKGRIYRQNAKFTGREAIDSAKAGGLFA